MLVIGDADLSDLEEIESLIAAYHVSENLRPDKERISGAIEDLLRERSRSLLLDARDDDRIVGGFLLS